MKFCIKCKENNDESKFHKNIKQPDGLDNRCKLCRKNEARHIRLSNYFVQYSRGKRSECKKKGIIYDLDAEYLQEIWTGTCPIFNTTINYMEKTGHINQAHLDRYDPNLGYVKGNVFWISGRANRIKYNATIQELELILNYMKHRPENV